MAPTVVATAGTNAIPSNPSTTGITVTHGFSLQNGDVLVAFVAMGDDDPTAFASSSGGTWVADTTNRYAESSVGNDIALGSLYRVVTNAAGEPSTYTFTATSASSQKTMVVQVVQVRGGKTVSPLDGVGYAARGTNDFTPTHANYDTTYDNSLLLIAHAASMTDGTTGKSAGKPSTATSLTSPGSQYQEDTAGTAGFDIFIETAYQTTTSAGTQTIDSWTGSPDDSASEWGILTVAIRERLQGATVMVITYGSTTVGRIAAKAQTASAYTFGSTTQAAFTGQARLSLESGGTPATRTDHSIAVRARTASGTGKLTVALFEGSTNVSGWLTPQTLTGSLAAYSFTIADAAAETISSYADLEVRVEGIGVGGSAVFEVAEVSLSIPAASEAATGSSVLPVTYGSTTSGRLGARGQSAVTFTYASTTQARVVAKGQTASAYAYASTTSGTRTVFGQSTSDYTYDATTQGRLGARSAATQDYTFDVYVKGINGMRASVLLQLTQDATTSGILDAHAQTTQALAYDSTTQGRAIGLGATTSAYTFDAVTDGTGSTPSTTIYGSVATDLTLGLTTSGTHYARGASSSAYTLTSAISGRLTARGQVALALALAAVTSARVGARGQVILPLAFASTTTGSVAGAVYGSVATALTLTETTSGTLTARGQVDLPLSVGETTTATLTVRGRIDLPLSLALTTSGTSAGAVFGSSVLALTLDEVTVGIATRRGAVVLPLTYDSTSAGAYLKRGRVALPLTLGETTVGHIDAHGQVVLPLTLTEVTSGHAILYGRAAELALVLALVSNGIRQGAPLNLLDAIATGRIDPGWAGYIDGRVLGHIEDEEPGLVAEEV